MSRLEWSFKVFSKKGLKFLFLEFIIVFAGVYLAFLFQNYSANLKVNTEQEKVLIGLKQNLEYFRLLFPGYAANAENLVQNWHEQQLNGNYANYHTWRFIQPQYDYSALEYALNSEADVINFEMHSAISEVYQELKKLQHTEEIITELAMLYQPVPSELQSSQQGKLIEANNLHVFKKFIDRSTDRHNILKRIAETSSNVLPEINRQFSAEELKTIELELIKNQINVSQGSQLDQYIPFLMNYFPNLEEDELRALFEVSK